MRRYISIHDRIMVLFSGLPGGIGWALLAFSLIFVLVFGMTSRSDIIYLLSDKSSWPQTTGIVIDSEVNTMATDAGWEYHIQYKVKNELMTTSAYGVKGVYQLNDKVRLRHHPNKTDIIVADRLHRKDINYGVLAVLIFPIAAFLLIGYGIKKNRAKLKTLQLAKTTMGKYVGTEETNITINKVPLMQMFYEFIVNDKAYAATRSTQLAEELSDHSPKLVYYDPADPYEAQLQTEISGKPTIEGNAIRFKFNIFSYFRFILPAIALYELYWLARIFILMYS